MRNIFLLFTFAVIVSDGFGLSLDPGEVSLQTPNQKPLNHCVGLRVAQYLHTRILNLHRVYFLMPDRAPFSNFYFSFRGLIRKKTYKIFTQETEHKLAFRNSLRRL
jgi:hypothetical protein